MKDVKRYRKIKQFKKDITKVLDDYLLIDRIHLMVNGNEDYLLEERGIRLEEIRQRYKVNIVNFDLILGTMLENRRKLYEMNYERGY